MASFFSDSGLTWYLGELRREELAKFKELLKLETSQLGLQQIPWTEVKTASREVLADLLIQHCGEQQAWNTTFRIFGAMGREDLCERARRESTGPTKMYRDHIRNTFPHVWSRDSVFTSHEFEWRLTEEEQESLEYLLAPTDAGRQSRTVVLQGSGGIGKTALLRKLMLAWSDSILYQDRFSYVFYLCCREVRQLASTSLVSLISRDWPHHSTPLADVVSQPERLLFLVDNVEEMSRDMAGPPYDLCSHWMEPRPGQVLLRSLLAKTLLPDAFLLLAVTPQCQGELLSGLRNPSIKTILGFNRNSKKLYFSGLFPNKRRATEAFQLVSRNGCLFSMCKNPILCWVMGMSMKQDMDRGKDPALTCRSVTSMFISFLFNSFTPKDAMYPTQQSREQLKSLCSLAAEGTWTHIQLFNQEALRRNGIGDAAVPTLLDTKVLRYQAPKNVYGFLHETLLQLCTALFYLLQHPSAHPSPAVQCTRTLLLTVLNKRRSSTLLGLFLFGLLSERERQKLDAFFGSNLSRQRKEELEQLLQGMSGCAASHSQVDFLVLFYYLSEIQDDVFAGRVMACFQELNLTFFSSSDLRIAASYLKHCYNLRKLCLSVVTLFKGENTGAYGTRQNFLYWSRICSVLTSHEHLQELQVVDSSFTEPTLVIFCHQLRQPGCHLQKLVMNTVTMTCEKLVFFEVFTYNPGLKYLNLNCVNLSSGDMKLLCEALNHPMCGIQELLLTSCHLSEDAWKPLAQVLICNCRLLHLDISINSLGDVGLKQFCDALRYPGCRLRSLCVCRCLITTSGCGNLAQALVGSQDLRCLQVGSNSIEDAGVKLLCEALVQPSCHLETLGLQMCGLSGACCEDLAYALISSKTLQDLDLSWNALDHHGLAVLLAAVSHPGCALRVLRLKHIELGEETQALLMAAQERNPYLTVISQ
ncbi:NACHT, LRR and PYD domains-containing protein 4 [Lepus europaeus]|uniref:NACHT, LRR and PYD domains-containing protein 4 n=1 Tax=Lepus europaeus TaxID=9983 RepID=UPI002B4994E8|nr:NACHT, LRR and PYD domains-containing protein 4 [Lepus europaeus]